MNISTISHDDICHDEAVRILKTEIEYQKDVARKAAENLARARHLLARRYCPFTEDQTVEGTVNVYNRGPELRTYVVTKIGANYNDNGYRLYGHRVLKNGNGLSRKLEGIDHDVTLSAVQYGT